MSEISVSIFKRAGQDVWYMQYRDPETGRKIPRTTRKTNRRDAERVAGKWEQDILNGRDNCRGRMPWEQFKTRYEDEAVSGLADSTDRKVAAMFAKVAANLHPAKLGSVTADSLQRLQKSLRDEGLSESSIKSHLAHLRAALQWAVNVGLLNSVPKFPKTQRAKATRVMKGRPLATEEFERMLDKVEAALVEACQPTPASEYKRWNPAALDAVRKRREALAAAGAESWRYLLRGLWLSGLRLTEALELHWTDENKLRVDLSCRHPMLRIPAELEKGHKDRLLPIAPEFAEFLLATPQAHRHGYVFNPKPIRADKAAGRLGEQQVGRIVGNAGRLANVKVAEKAAGKVKFASAHDLRRSFGERWSTRVMPQVLMELMRHESMDTTLRYYVGRNAQQTASVLWDAHRQALGVNLGVSADSSQETKSPATTEVITGQPVSKRGAGRS